MIPVAIDFPVLNAFIPLGRVSGAAVTAYICNPLIDVTKMYVADSDSEIAGNFKYRLLYNVSDNYVVGFVAYTPVQQTKSRPYLLHVRPKLIEEPTEEYDLVLKLQKLGVLLYRSKTDSSILAVSTFCASTLAVRLP